MSGNSWLWILFPGRCGRLGPCWGVGATGDNASTGAVGQRCGEAGTTPAPSRRQPGIPKHVGMEEVQPVIGLNVHKMVVPMQVCAQVPAQGEDLHTRVQTHTPTGVGAHTGTGTRVGTNGWITHGTNTYRHTQTGTGTHTGTGERTDGCTPGSQVHRQVCQHLEVQHPPLWTHRITLTWRYKAPWQHAQAPGTPRHPKHQDSTADPQPIPWWWQWKPLGFDPKTQFTFPLERPRWSTKSWGCEEGTCQCHAVGTWIAMGKLRQEQGGQRPGC